VGVDPPVKAVERARLELPLEVVALRSRMSASVHVDVVSPRRLITRPTITASTSEIANQAPRIATKTPIYACT
jgi:hypothetical protein